jgi:hypothetical protein
MTSVISKIQDHYKSAISGDLTKYHCEEWDCDIYYRKTYPFKDEARVIELQAQGKTAEALTTSLVLKARKADGSKMFTEADIITLMNEADPYVIVKVAAAINSAKIEAPVENIAKE